MMPESRRFPVQDKGPITVPWEWAEEVYKEYSAQFTGQTLERIAERGGFSASEMIRFLVLRIKRLEGEKR